MVSLSSSLLALLAVALTTPVPHPQSAQPLADRQKELHQLFDESWQNELKDSPEFASSIGDKRYNAQLADYSAEARNARLERDAHLLERFAAVNDYGVPEGDKVSRQLAIRELLLEQEASRFREWEMPVNQFNSFFVDLSQLWQQTTFANEQDYDDYIARLKQVPRVFEQQTNNMQMGMDEGRIPPRYLMQAALAQAKDIAGHKGEDSPFAYPLKQMPAGMTPKARQHVHDELLEAIATSVTPAYLRFVRFMEVSYVPKGREDPGIWAIPDGDAYYAFCVRRETTTDMTPQQIHAIGLAEVKRDAAEEQALFAKLGVKDVHELAAKIAADPALHPTSADALLTRYRSYLAAMQPRLPELFGRLPKTPLEVAPVPDYIAKYQAPAYYEPGSEKAGRPGRIRVNTYDYAHRSFTPVESVSYHEGEPGHHLQISLAQENTGLPEFRRYLQFTAFTEGWGLYAERLGKDLGFYRDPYEDFGRLDADMWRASRLVIDTGIHNLHWTRSRWWTFCTQTPRSTTRP